ncbi:NAD(P)/FAD-dependent oxidoreductase [Microbacterium sp.]|uniref:FAD-dependent oxidoreductase n=1 Tax=Microbacterium sp. TaxID=51671 RepID=UPI002623AEBF|nr:NAD(P)/FAD-dependent oxidoreductase [Microbacterium sp.]
MPDHDVAIVGAGPVGLLAACLLAQAEIDVAVYERRVDDDDRSKAIGIHPPGFAALDAVGVGDEVEDEALALDGGDVLWDGRVLASLSFSAQQRVLVLPQRRTHALLMQRLRQLPSARLLTGHEVRHVRNEEGMVHLELDTAGAPPRHATAFFVVAADGVRSGIRRRLGIGWRRRYGNGSYAMVDIAHERDDARVQLHCESAGLVESFPLPHGQRRWVAAETQGALGEADAFVDAIRERTGRQLELPAGLSPTVFRAQQHHAARLSAGRVVLLGDAAHEVSPIGGQGMNLGWAAALELAAALERSLTGARPEFREYERRVQHAVARAQRRSAFYMTVGHATKGPALAVRNGAIRLLGTAPLRRGTTNMITMQGGAAPFSVRRR